MHLSLRYAKAVRPLLYRKYCYAIPYSTYLKLTIQYLYHLIIYLMKLMILIIRYRYRTMLSYRVSNNTIVYTV